MEDTPYSDLDSISFMCKIKKKLKMIGFPNFWFYVYYEVSSSFFLNYGTYI